MIVLIILGVFILLLLTLILLPVTIDLVFDKDLILKVKYLGITLFDNKKGKKKKVKTDIKESAPQKKDGFIKKTYKQKGLQGAIEYFSAILVMVIKKLCRVIKRFKFRRFKLDIIVASNDAANTAIQYGRICAAVYPVISLLQSIADIKLDSINVSADFDKTKSELRASIFVKTQVLNLIIAAIGIMAQFLKLQRKEREKT